jgi:hypothetical protein
MKLIAFFFWVGAVLMQSGCVTRYASSAKPASSEISPDNKTKLVFRARIPHAAAGWRVVARNTFTYSSEPTEVNEMRVSVGVRNLSPNPLGVGIGKVFAATVNSAKGYIVLQQNEVQPVFLGRLSDFIKYSQSINFNNDATFAQKKEDLDFELIFQFPNGNLLSRIGRLRFVDTNAL